jgi:hypothetical protein
MAKKSSASSRPSKPLTEALDGIARRQKRGASSGVLQRNWWPCVWMPTYSNGFSSTVQAIPRASTTFFGWLCLKSDKLS